MMLGNVVGRVWSDRQTPGLEGMRFLVVRALDDSGTEQVAVDLLDVGVGATVLVATEEAAAAAARVAGVDAAIIALVSDYERLPSTGGRDQRQPQVDP